MIINAIVGTSQNVIRITGDQMLAFHRIQRILPDIQLMIDEGVFDFKRGRAIIHRDDNGILRRIDLEVTKWSK